MKHLAILILSAVALFGQHTASFTWTWSQGTGQPATQFNIMQSQASGGCVQPVNPATCTQVGTAVATATAFTTSVTADTSHQADPLVEGNTYCYVVVTQGAGGILSVNSNESCGIVKKTESAPQGVQVTFN